MTLHATVQGLWTYVSGEPKELRRVQDRLDQLERQLSPDGELGGAKLWDEAGDGLWVLTGAWLSAFPVEDEAVRGASNSIFRGARYAVDRLEQLGILRDYQAMSVVAALSAPWSRGVIKIPTGGGKTRVCVGIVMVGAMVNRIDRWVYLVSNKQLAAQTQDEFDAVGQQMAEALKVGDMRAGEMVRCLSYGQVDVDELRGWAGGAGARLGILVDEVHGIPARTRAEALLRLGVVGRVEAVIGLSATPLDRSDEKNARVLGLIGPIVYEITMDVLVSGGYLARGKVVVHPL